ncbi:WhiB family transcriptional regulator [Streptomyces hirsutus]|uniref:WhiB family transcriptional regulator n=1 Tax=Streptomyces hirsutus TaxID=35620 RepID=UPI003687E665
MTADRYAWMSSALCAQADPDQWTDSTGRSQDVPKSICARCPVAAACTAHATALHRYDGLAMSGVWGGHSQRQRKQQAA